MKKESVNQFNQGMNLDLHPMVTPNSVLTDDLNGTFITYNGNEFCLQNDKGNFRVAGLSEGYEPIGAKEYNGVIYVVSVKNITKINEETGEEEIDEANCLTEIGTYPGLDWNVPKETENILCYDDGTPSGRLAYTPLGNFKKNDETNYGAFTNAKLGYSTLTPVTIEIQPSYDGSVNLILTDGKNPVRMINSAFSVLPNDRYKLIERRGDDPVNYYEESRIDTLELIKNSRTLSNVELHEVISGGQLKGGNYTLYIKFGDDDFNQTDVVAESGIISVFNGNDCAPYTISGTLLDERTDKKIRITVTNVDPQYSKIYVYYSREYSDTLGYRLTEYGKFKDPFSIKNQNNVDIWLTGFEQTETINREEINIDYHTVDFARAEAQQQNMLFLGNIGQKETFQLYMALQEKALAVQSKVDLNTTLKPVSYLYNRTEDCRVDNAEYYSTHNIYYNLGYWPNEWYRFGVVFVLEDGSTTPVFNIRGGIFNGLNQDPIDTNDFGIFKTPDVDILGNGNVKPLCFQFLMPDLDGLAKGYFYVRQKRIPTTICQGLRIGVDKKSHLPITWNGKRWITQSFLASNRWNLMDSQQDNDSGLMPVLEYYNKSILPDENQIIFTGLLNEVAYLDSQTVNSNLEEWQNQYQEIINSSRVIYSDDFEETIENSQIYTYKFIITHRYVTGSRSNSGRYAGNSSREPGSFREIEPEEIYYVSYSTVEFIPEFINNKICWDSTSESALSKAQTEQASRINSQHIRPLHQSNAYNQKIFEKKYIVYSDTDEDKYAYGLLSLDPAVVSSIGNMLDGSEFEVVKEYETTTYFGSKTCESDWKIRGEGEDILSSNNTNDSFLQIWDKPGNKIYNDYSEAQCIFIPPNTKIKEVGGIGFSNVAGSASDPSQYSYTSESFGVQGACDTKRGENNNHMLYGCPLNDEIYNTALEYRTSIIAEMAIAQFFGIDVKKCSSVGFNSILNINILRGLFTPFIGTTKSLDTQGIYSIRLKSISDDNAKIIRQQDESPYYTVSKRINSNKWTNIYRGDCYTSTVSMRILRNFIDPDTPIADNILDFDNWNEYVRQPGDVCDDESHVKLKGLAQWQEVNRADVNTVDLGYWVTFKCLSSYNLGLRSLDRFDTKEVSLMGTPKSFFPLNCGSTSTGNKVGESFLLNDGYSATVGEKVFNLFDSDLPYTQSEFANRIIFSNVQVDNAYTNGYRTFQGLSYQDYDKQYGAIVKLVPWDNNLLVVMEHGIGVVGVNEQALMQTNTADTIHIYGHGVLSDHMQIISPDYGSKYEHSVIRTPIGVYGIDTDARKIWRVSTQKGFETLSDMKIESYLNDELGTNVSIDLPLFDVRTHYNATKGDIMFTFFKKLFKKQDKKVEPRNSVKPESQKYFNISTAEEVLSENEVISRSFSTNLPESEVIASIGDENIAVIELDFENKKLITHGLEAGGTDIDIAGKKIPVRVKTEEEIRAEEQQEIANQTGTESTTETTTEIDPETGEPVEVEKPIVTGKVKILPGSHQWSFYVGDTYTIPINFSNNTIGLTLQDCEVVSYYENGGSAEILKVGNSLKVTPLSEGKWRFGVHNDLAKGFDTGWITFVKKIFWINLQGTHGDGDVVDVTTPVGNYFELTAYGNNYGKVTISGFDTSIVSGGVTETTSRIWFFGNKVGDTTAIITDTGSDDSVTVNLHVVNCIDIDNAKFYLNGSEITSLTMQVGETKRVTWKYFPENHPGSTSVISAGLTEDTPQVYDSSRPTEIQVANASYSLGSCYSNITAIQKGTINWTIFISPSGGGNVTYVKLPITVNE